MKKIFVIVLVIIIAMSSVACGQEQQTAIDKCQARVIEIGEQFLNYEISTSEAKAALDDIIVPYTEGNGDLYLDCNISYLSFCLTLKDYSEFEEELNYIKSADYND